MCVYVNLGGFCRLFVLLSGWTTGMFHAIVGAFHGKSGVFYEGPGFERARIRFAIPSATHAARLSKAKACAFNTPSV